MRYIILLLLAGCAGTTPLEPVELPPIVERISNGEPITVEDHIVQDGRTIFEFGSYW